MRAIMMAVGAAAVLSSGAASAETGSAAARQAAKSVVRVFVPDPGNPGHVASGSGFVISGEYIATALHVVNGAAAIKVMRDGMAAPLVGEVVATEPRRDLAIVRVSGLQLPALPLYVGESDSAQGEQAYVDGFPGESDRYERTLALAPLIQTVNIQRIVHGSYEGGAGAPFAIVEFGPTLGGGFSGSPLLDSCGRVIGVASKSALAGALTTDGVQRVPTDQPTSRATDASELVELARRSNFAVVVQTNECTSDAAALVAKPAAQTTAIVAANPPATAPTAANGMRDYLPYAAGAIVLLGLIGGAALLSRRRPAATAEPAVPERRSETVVVPAPVGKGRTTVIGKALELTGRSSTAYGTRIVITPAEFRSDRNMVDLYRDEPGAGRKVLSQSAISNPHARFTYEPGAEEKMYIQDLNSSNGTTVNGQPVTSERVRLVNGDIVTFARSYEFEVAIRDSI